MCFVPVGETGNPDIHCSAGGTPPPVLRVMTLNAAHGRKHGAHQLLLSRNTIEQNLLDIASMVLREAPQFVALQEADGPCFWSGNFSHVERLASLSGCSHHVHAHHVKLGWRPRRRLLYGTALLSRLPLRDSRSFTFRRSWPMAKKGFVKATLSLPGPFGMDVDVVSVHLDFFHRAIRHNQRREMVQALSHQRNPLIILGDMNCHFNNVRDAMHRLCADLNVRPYEPQGADLGTFPYPYGSKRLDWILLSPGLTFHRYAVLSDGVSDHHAVVADVGIAVN